MPLIVRRITNILVKQGFNEVRVDIYDGEAEHSSNYN